MRFSRASSLLVSHKPVTLALAIIVTAIVLHASPAKAQNGRPEPQQPQSQGAPTRTAAAEPTRPQDAAATQSQPGTNGNAGPLRPRKPPEGKVTLAFNDVPVDEKIIAFIAESTGKVVMPVGLAGLKAKKITLMNDEPIDRSLALDLLLRALNLNGVGVLESPEVVVLDIIDNMKTHEGLTVMGPNDDVMNRHDRGAYVVKVFRLKEASAETVSEHVQDNLPNSAAVSVDINTNQIILFGTIELAQQVQKIINELDINQIRVRTETFRLAYADAQALSDQIYELFDESGTTQGGAQRAQRTQQQRQGQQPRPGQPGQPGVATPAGVSQPGPQVELRVSVNVKQNSLTVSAEPKKVDAIAKLIREQWDLPIPPGNSKVYRLKYSDPVRVRDLLQSLLGAGGSTGSNAGNRAAAPRGAQQVNFGQGANNAGSSVSQVIGDIYRIEAYPDMNAVIVVSKTQQSLDYLDAIIASIDQKSDIGLPHVVPLKHADAFSLADELNVLLAESGTGNGLQRPGAGLSRPNNLSSVSQDQTGTGTTGTTGTTGATGTGQTGGAQGTVNFPWQTAQPRQDQADPSSLIGKVRIVPIERQNALAIVAPPAQQQAVIDLIENFDRPGRQVMISCIIAEVQLKNEFALGVRFSSSDLSSSIADNSVGGTLGFTGTNNNVLSGIFDTGVLNTDVNINVLLQAIAQKTNVRILQKPRVFTADNQEAVFFDGQDVPFISNSSTNTGTGGGLTQSFSYKAVGVQLDVRPRITAQRDVDMEIDLVLSDIVPGQTLFGGAILDRRETTSKIIVKNGQTIVLSGILTDNESQITRGVPLLSDIPWIGEIFKSHENSKITTELIAFITPEVVDNPAENETEKARERLNSLSEPLKQQAKHAKTITERILERSDIVQPAAESPTDLNPNAPRNDGTQPPASQPADNGVSPGAAPDKPQQKPSDQPQSP